MKKLDRYHRQTLLPQVGAAGQEKLSRVRVLLIGCGALGTVIAEQLVRAGVGQLTIADRDTVELTNLQRQTLFDENDAAEETPKAIAAAARLRLINSEVEIRPLVTDVHSGNIEALAGLSANSGLNTQHSALILDGTDNASTRYLINDVAVKHGISWVYGGAVATEGRVMAIVPGKTPCLRCLFPTPPGAGDLPTCDTAGVLGMGATIVGAYQAMQAIKILVGGEIEEQMLVMDFWPWRMRSVSTAEARRGDCRCCGQRQFDFLNARADSTLSMCGRNAMQIRPALEGRMDLEKLATKLRRVGDVQRTVHLVRCQLWEMRGVGLTVFADGRTLIHGITDGGRAKSIYARFVGV